MDRRNTVAAPSNKGRVRRAAGTANMAAAWVFADPAMATTPINNPVVMVPELPMKTAAGGKLLIRNANSAPDRVRAKTAGAAFPFMMPIAPSAAATIIP